MLKALLSLAKPVPTDGAVEWISGQRMLFEGHGFHWVEKRATLHHATKKSALLSGITIEQLADSEND